MNRALDPRCVCGHVWTFHQPDEDDRPGAACDGCACRAFLAEHLPGQLTIGEGA